MKIAYTMAPKRGGTDLLLFDVAKRLLPRGIRCCGTVQINTGRAEGPCDMDVRILPDGPVVRISQNLGPASKGCRLDPVALETAVAQVSASLDTGADLLIVNKFGKHEADGRGFREVIAKAIGLDIPVIVGVNTLNLRRFQDFVGEDAVQLAPSSTAILDWLDRQLVPRQAVS